MYLNSVNEHIINKLLKKYFLFDNFLWKTKSYTLTISKRYFM